METLNKAFVLGMIHAIEENKGVEIPNPFEIHTREWSEYLDGKDYIWNLPEPPA